MIIHRGASTPVVPELGRAAVWVTVTTTDDEGAGA